MGSASVSAAAFSDSGNCPAPTTTTVAPTTTTTAPAELVPLKFTG